MVKGLARSAVAVTLLVTGACARQPPNVLILVADDLGVDAVGVYGEGAAPPPTPNIDALAARGVLFRNAWSNPVCSSTRAAIMTGRYSFRTGIGAARQPGTRSLSFAETTLPEALDAAESGYSHAAIGKWHLGGGRGAPGRAGWGHSVQGPILLVRDYYDWPRFVDGERTASKKYMTSQLVDDALAWVGAQEGPWVLYLSFYAPHGPWMAPPPELHTQDLSAADGARHAPEYFKPMVEAMDTEIGRLLDGLGRELENTNVLFMADNGTAWAVTEPPFVPEHGKGTPYEGGVNVPLVVAGPAIESPGRESEALVSAVDLFASVLDLVGIDRGSVLDPAVPVDSVSFVPLLRDPTHPPTRSTVYAERFENWNWESMDTTGFATARDKRFKLVRYFVFDRDELYDLTADPWEAHDLLASAQGGEDPTDALDGEARLAYEALSAEIDSLRGSATYQSELARPAPRPAPQRPVSGRPVSGRPAPERRATPAPGSR